MKKALVITSVASMVDQFLLPSIDLLQSMGFEVHVACNFERGSSCSNERIAILKRKLEESNVVCCQIDFARSIMSFRNNIRAYNQVKCLFQNNEYRIVHCHSPIGGVVTRLACKKARKQGTKIIYTAHGFHFYKGAPLKNWILFYTVEKYCAKFTDVLITINKEDFERAKKKFKAKSVEYIPGVGIDVDKFANVVVDVEKKREEIGVSKDSFLLLSVGELNKNKNHETVIRSIAEMGDPRIHYAIAGRGDLQEHLLNVADELGIGDRVHLLGFRSDVAELYKAADAFIHPSFREGLPVSIMEAMASGLPVIASDIRGNVDLVDDESGLLFCASSIEDCKTSIIRLMEKNADMVRKHNLIKSSAFSFVDINSKLKAIYDI